MQGLQVRIDSNFTPSRDKYGRRLERTIYRVVVPVV
jgi:hypothetical protein